MNSDEDAFTSVNWESADDAQQAAANQTQAASSSRNPTQASGVELVLGTHSVADPYSRAIQPDDDKEPKWAGYLLVQVTEARKEHEGTKEMFVSYGIRAEVSCCMSAKGRIVGSSILISLLLRRRISGTSREHA